MSNDSFSWFLLAELVAAILFFVILLISAK